MSSENQTKKKISMNDAFKTMVKNFQGETGIVMGNLNSLYNAQMQDIMINYANLRAELDSTKNKATSLAAEKDQLIKEVEELKRLLRKEEETFAKTEREPTTN